MKGFLETKTAACTKQHSIPSTWHQESEILLNRWLGTNPTTDQATGTIPPKGAQASGIQDTGPAGFLQPHAAERVPLTHFCSGTYFDKPAVSPYEIVLLQPPC